MTQLKISERKFLLNKIAKRKQSELNGKQNRKSMEKLRNGLSDNFNKTRLALEQMELQKFRLEKEIDRLRSEYEAGKEDVAFCHEVLRGMDFTGASAVKINGPNKSDVAYSCDGRWMAVDDNYRTIPYRQSKLQTLKENIEGDEQLALDGTTEDNESFEDELDLDFDGVDVSRE